MDILDAKLEVGNPAIIVLHDGVAYIDGIACLYMPEVRRLVESYGRDMPVRLLLLDEFEFHVPAFRAHLAAVAVIIDVLCHEHRGTVAWSERLELLEYPEELRGDLGEVKP